MHLKIKNNCNYLRAAFSLFVVIASGCQTTDEKSTAGLPPKGYNPPLAVQMELNGSNRLVDISADGRFYIYVSSSRSVHDGDQIYSLDAQEKKEKRVTFQDGEIHDLQYGDSLEWIYFSGTTDEIKENPPFIRETLSKRAGLEAPQNPYTDFTGNPLPETEIYRMKKDGSEIERITRSENFDGQIAFHPSTGDLYFTSVRTGRPQIFRLKKGQEEPTKFSHAENEEQYPSLSADGKTIAYVRRITPSQFELIAGNPMTRNWTKVLESNEPIFEPVFTPSGKELLFLKEQSGSKNREIFSIALDGSCQRQLTYNNRQEFGLRAGHTGDSIYYSAGDNKKARIFEMKYAPPPCPKANPPVN